jgi:hypothetical protein
VIYDKKLSKDTSKQKCLLINLLCRYRTHKSSAFVPNWRMPESGSLKYIMDQEYNEKSVEHKSYKR